MSNAVTAQDGRLADAQRALRQNPAFSFSHAGIGDHHLVDARGQFLHGFRLTEAAVSTVKSVQLRVAGVA